VVNENEVRAKRGPRPKGRHKPPFPLAELVTALAHSNVLLEVCRHLPHLGDEGDGFMDGPRKPGRKPRHPPELMVLFGVVSTWVSSDEQTQAELQHPTTWEPLRCHLAELFPLYSGLQPGAAGPNRSQFNRWYKGCAHNHEALVAFKDAFEAAAAVQARNMDLANPNRRSLSTPDLRDTVIGDGTNVKSRFNHGPGDYQYDRDTGAIEEIPHDPDASFQVRKNDHGETITSNTAGTPFGFLSATTSHPGETVVLSVFNIPTGPTHSEMQTSMIELRRLAERLPGLDHGLWDMATRGTHIDEAMDFGLLLHAKVPFVDAKKKTPKERLTDSGLVAKRDGVAVGTVDIYARAGAAHIEVNIGGDRHLVVLEPGRVHDRRSRSGKAITRIWREYRIPDAPEVPRKLRGAVVEVRHNTNADDRARGLNRAEVLRIIAEVHQAWSKAAQRNRAESLNQWVKRHWQDKRGPAVGKERQQMRLAFASIGLNVISALHYEKRTGIDILGPPGEFAAAA
jgi:hypothetical protein